MATRDALVAWEKVKHTDNFANDAHSLQHDFVFNLSLPSTEIISGVKSAEREEHRSCKDL